LAAIIPGRRNVHSRAEVSISRSISACQAVIKSLGESEISAYHCNARRQASRPRIAGERGDLHARILQLREQMAADVAASSYDEDTIQAGPILPAESQFLHPYCPNVTLNTRVSPLRISTVLTLCNPFF
jgi:hypothetical protein